MTGLPKEDWMGRAILRIVELNHPTAIEMDELVRKVSNYLINSGIAHIPRERDREFRNRIREKIEEMVR